VTGRDADGRLQPECVILAGLPGAGKTTFYLRHFGNRYRHVSKDRAARQRGADADERRKVDEALASGISVVVDNTHPSAERRAALIAIARARDARVVCYFFDVTTRQAVARNAQRAGPDRVPNVAIFTCAKHMEPPTLAEGYDQLFWVTVADDRTSRVREVR